MRITRLLLGRSLKVRAVPVLHLGMVIVLTPDLTFLYSPATFRRTLCPWCDNPPVEKEKHHLNQYNNHSIFKVRRDLHLKPKINLQSSIKMKVMTLT